MAIVRQPADQIKPTQVKWLWPKYMALGQITILDGDPGAGKSFLTLDLAARLSCGRSLPGCQARTEPQKVLICNAEDDVSSTLIPRLRKLGADLTNVEFANTVELPEQKSRPLIFPNDYHFLEQLLDQVRPCLCVIDPIMAFLSPDVRTFQDQAIRLALNPLKDLARAFEVAILLVRHLNKSQVAKAIYRGGGSIGLIGVCRSALLAGENPDVRGERILTQIKNNLAKKQPALAYDLFPEKGGQVFTWLGRREVTADQALVHNIGLTPLAEAIQKLKDYLAAGPVRAKSAAQHLLRLGFSGASIARAQKGIPVIATKITKYWYWSLSPIPDAQGRKFFWRAKTMKEVRVFDVSWLGQTPQHRNPSPRGRPGSRQLACQRLLGYLDAGPARAGTVLLALADLGFGAVRKARVDIGAVATKIGKYWYWSLSPISQAQREELARARTSEVA